MTIFSIISPCCRVSLFFKGKVDHPLKSSITDANVASRRMTCRARQVSFEQIFIVFSPLEHFRANLKTNKNLYSIFNPESIRLLVIIARIFQLNTVSAKYLNETKNYKKMIQAAYFSSS